MSFTNLYIDQAVVDLEETKTIVQRINERLETHPQTIADSNAIYHLIAESKDPIQAGKKVLWLTRNKSVFLKSCPGTSHYTCCDYKILHIGSYCTMDCSYCILQTYFHPPVLQFFINFNDLWQELDGLFAEKRKVRVGTGEFTDSQIWNQWTDLNSQLVQKFGTQHHAILELKTKTNAIDCLEGLPHNKKTILAWSLNTETVINSEERGTASLTARLKAAAKCQSWGYPLAFHFDPIVLYKGCGPDYEKVVKMLFDFVSPDNVVWISLGTFRFIPDLKPIMQKRFKNSKIVYGEFISGLDNKMRYFKPLRIDIYKQLISAFRAVAPQVTLYFCMEDDAVWQKTLGYTPSERGGLPYILDKSAAYHCNIK